MKRALVVIDYQNDFVSGTLGSEAARSIEGALCARVKEAISDGYDVFFTRDTHDSGYPDTNEGSHIPVTHCIRGTYGWEIHGSLRDLSETCTVIDKPTFGSDKLAHVLSDGGYGEVELCGVATNICVIVNAALIRTALPEADILVDPRLVASYDDSLGRAALEVMKGFCIDVLKRSRAGSGS